MSDPLRPSRFLSDQSGGILTAALGAVAMVGILSYGAYTLLSGPVRSASNVTNSSKIKTDMDAIARVLVTKKVDAGDGDADLEMPAPVAGTIPVTVFPVTPVDPWNQTLRYCAWNTEGATTTAIGTILDGTGTALTDISFVLISAGPDRNFQISCVAAMAFLSGTPGDDLVYKYKKNNESEGGPPGSGAGGGGSAEVWGLTDTVTNDPTLGINYTADSVLVGSIASPSSAKLQVERDTAIRGNLTVGGAVSLGAMDVNGVLGITSLTLQDNAATVGPVEGNVEATTSVDVATALTVMDNGLVVNLNTDKLDGQHGAYYLDLANATGKLDPEVLPEFTGDFFVTKIDADSADVKVRGIRGIPLPAIGVVPANGQVMRYYDGITPPGTAGFEYWSPVYAADVTGPLESNDVVKIQNRDVTATAPVANNVLGWNGGAWAPMSIGTAASATVAAFSGANFLATSTAITAGACPTNRIPKRSGAGWVCSTDILTGYDELPLNIDTVGTNKRIIQANAAADPFLGFYGFANTYIGIRAGKGLEAASPEPVSGDTNSTRNTLMGYYTGRLLTTGYQNTFVGAFAGEGVTTGNRNTYVGYEAAQSNDTGNENVALGYRAGAAASAAYSQTVLVGAEAGAALTSGARNTMIGYRAGFFTTTATDNTYVGYESGVNATGSHNTFIGNRTGDGLTTGQHNVLVGDGAGGSASATSFSYNVAVGSNAAAALTTGERNVMLGFSVGDSLTTGSGNVFLGWKAGDEDVSSNGNVFIGLSAAGAKTGTGESNVGVGAGVFELGVDFSQEVAIGGNAARSANGSSNNVVLGFSAGEYMTSATNNVLVGNYVARDGDGNTNFTGSNNVIVGFQAAQTSTTGPTTASDNVIVGKDAGQNLTTGSGNIILGKGNSIATGATDDYLTIGTNQAGVGQVFYGDMTTGNMTLKGTLATSSDRRLKHKIRPIENAMQKIMQLNGVLYKWKKSYKDDDRDYFGLIAQEVKKIVPEVVYQLGEGKMSKYMSVSYEQLTPLLIEGIKEQDRELNKLNQEIDVLIAKQEANKKAK